MHWTSHLSDKPRLQVGQRVFKEEDCKMTRTNIACLHSLAFDGWYVSSFRNQWAWSESWDTETVDSLSWDTETIKSRSWDTETIKSRS